MHGMVSCMDVTSAQIIAWVLCCVVQLESILHLFFVQHALVNRIAAVLNFNIPYLYNSCFSIVRKTEIYVRRTHSKFHPLNCTDYIQLTIKLYKK